MINKKISITFAPFLIANIVLLFLNLKKMKKVFLSLAVVCSVALVSCGGNKTENTEDTMAPVEAIEVEQVVTVDTANCDSICCDTTVQAEGAVEVAQ